MIFRTIIIALALFSFEHQVHGKANLQEAAEIGDLDVVKSLVQSGAGVNSTDDRGRTALYVASIGGKSNVVDYLLNQGADPNKGASWKADRTPLQAAAMYNNLGIIQNLLRHGAKIDAADAEGQTALHRAAWYGRSAAVKLLLKEGARPNAEDVYGYSSLHFKFTPQEVNVLNGSSLGKIPSDFREVAELLISAGADINAPAKKPKGYTPLMAACAVAPIEVVDYLLSKGANADAKTETGATAFSIAQAKKRTDVQDLLKAVNKSTGK